MAQHNTVGKGGGWCHLHKNTLRKMEKHALILFLMFPLLSRQWNLIGVYESRGWKRASSDERQEKREKDCCLSIMLLRCSEVTIGASKASSVKAFLFFSSSHPSLPPRRVSRVPSLHHCWTTDCFTEITLLCTDSYLPMQWTLSHPTLSNL